MTIVINIGEIDSNIGDIDSNIGDIDSNVGERDSKIVDVQSRRPPPWRAELCRRSQPAFQNQRSITVVVAAIRPRAKP